MKIERDVHGKTRVAKGDKSGFGGRFAPDIDFFRNKQKNNQQIIETIDDSEIHVDELALTLNDNLNALKDFMHEADPNKVPLDIANDFYSSYISCDDATRATIINQMTPEEIETVYRHIHPKYGNAFLTSTVLTENDYQDVRDAYIEAAFFTSQEEELDGKTINHLSWQAEVSIDEDIQEFVAHNLELVAEAIHREGYGKDNFGHDYWMSRSGTGVGFNDREPLRFNDLGSKLDHSVRESNKYEWQFIVGDDGRLYLE